MTLQGAKISIQLHIRAHKIGEPPHIYIGEALDLALQAIDKQIPEKPIEEADDFGDRSVCCPSCLGPVTNYWVPGTLPKHCQFCGQALDWRKETNE